jgi:hypothetical protein
MLFVAPLAHATQHWPYTFGHLEPIVDAASQTQPVCQSVRL